MRLRSLGYYRAALEPGRFFRSRPDGRHVPVFMYHHAEPRSFERHLRFLRDNGYRGVSCDQVDWADPDPRDVVLTFDDGRRSVWSVAAPILRRSGFRATTFVSPGMIEEGDPTPSIESSGAARELEARYFGNHELFNWAEAHLLVESGAVDLQLHGFAHSRVFISPRLMGFYHPGWKDEDAGIAGWIVRSGGGDTVVSRPELGQPMYEWGSRWGSAPRYLEIEDASEACTRHVSQAGGADFFRRAGWREELETVWRALGGGGRGRLETDAEKRTHLEQLLRRAKTRLEERIGVTAEHFALPWAQGNEMISSVAEATGVRHVYWESSIPEYATGQSPDVSHHYRLKEQSLLRLPGKGRQGLLAVLGVVARSYWVR